jgi:hypothetical protein
MSRRRKRRQFNKVSGDAPNRANGFFIIMKHQGIEARVKLLVAFLLAAIVLAFCQSVGENKMPVALPPTPSGNSSANPVEDISEVSAMCTLTGGDATLDVPAGRPVRITWGWSAVTETQVRNYIDQQITLVTLDGVALNGVALRGIQPMDQNFAVFWKADVGVLSPGRHVILYTGTWKKSIDDGHKTFGPGGETERLFDRCEIVVK